MADQDPRETLRVALRDLDSQALHTLMVAAYDRWNWESGSDMDKDWFEIADELLKERGIVSANTLQFGPPANVGAPMMTMGNAPADIKFKANKVTMEAPNNSIECEVFDMSNGNVEIGFDLKRLIIQFLTQEIQSGSMPGITGNNLQGQLEMLITGQINMSEWAIQPMIERAIQEYDEKRKAEEGVA